VKISRKDFARLLAQYPRVESTLWHSVVDRLKETGNSRREIRQSQFLDTALNKGLVEGNSILVIDLSVCTRCDDCVRGCADTHGDIPRFVREGDKAGNFLITRACYHCEDPVCLVGCPTGAIRRADVGDVVFIDDNLCIGCGTCANNCPYDAITMHGTGEQWPGDMIPEGLRGKDKQIATKCDLCYQDPAGPACVRSCPHGCAFRVGDVKEFRSLLLKKGRTW
jgi:Fe-S-cluster-containing hydrogenase component 2